MIVSRSSFKSVRGVGIDTSEGISIIYNPRLMSAVYLVYLDIGLRGRTSLLELRLVAMAVR